jgi:hypothetical protein
MYPLKERFRSAWQKTPMAEDPGPSIDAFAFTIRDP